MLPRGLPAAARRLVRPPPELPLSALPAPSAAHAAARAAWAQPPAAPVAAAVGRAGVGGWQVLCYANGATPAALLLQAGTAWLHTFAALMQCCREPPRAVKRRQGVSPSATAAATAGRLPLLASPPAPCASSTAREWLLLLLTSGKSTIQGRGALNPGTSSTPSCWAGMAATPGTELVPAQAILGRSGRRQGAGELRSPHESWGSWCLRFAFLARRSPCRLTCRLPRGACGHTSRSAPTGRRVAVPPAACRRPWPLPPSRV